MEKNHFLVRFMIKKIIEMKELYYHELVHSVEKPFVSDISQCSYAVTLDNHYQIHTGEKLFGYVRCSKNILGREIWTGIM